MLDWVSEVSLTVVQALISDLEMFCSEESYGCFELKCFRSDFILFSKLNKE